MIKPFQTNFAVMLVSFRCFSFRFAADWWGLLPEGVASRPLAGHHPSRASGGGGTSHCIHRHHFTLPGLTATPSHYRFNSHRSHSSRFQPVNVIMVHSSTGQCHCRCMQIEFGIC